ncbi:MAG: rod shape-determining protein MreC [candidate division Zixibacteria bacterium]|nr:rod shape-determining protein MreC [candidate division Zixibacteria bacterium]
MNKISFVVTKNPNLLYLTTCVLLSLLLLALPGEVKSDFSAFIFRFTYAPFYALSHQIKQLQGVYQENKKLQQKVMELTLENSELKEEHLENSRLRALLEFRSELEYQVIPAEVVAAEPNRPLGRGSILINKGKEEGIKRNMPVLNLYGLVGKIEEVYPHRSTVQLMLDPDFRVSALDQRSRVFGIIKPHPGPGLLLNLDNVPLGEDVQIGDEVISAGLGGIFPAGLKIGIISNVGEGSLSKTTGYSGVFQEIEVIPSVYFNSLEELFALNIDVKR